MKKGSPICSTTSRKLMWEVEEMLRNLTTGIPASRRSLLVASLFMPMADPRTPAPTKGRLTSFNNPWMVPSSPRGPWRMGKTTSTGPSDLPWERLKSCPCSGWGRNTTWSFSFQLSFPRKKAGVTRRQRPSWSMPMRITSYLVLSMASKTFSADCSDISCSTDFPPKTSATLFLRSMVYCSSFCLYSTKWKRYQAVLPVIFLFRWISTWKKSFEG